MTPQPMKEAGSPRPDKREAIIDAAIEAFDAGGMGGATVDTIARRAGIAKGTVYLYFKSREEIFNTILRERWPGPLPEQLIQGLVDVPPLGAAGMEEAMTRLGLGFLNAVESNMPVFRLLLTAAYQFREVGDDLFENTFLKVNRLLANVLERQQQLGTLRPLPSPLITARCLQGMLMMYILSQDILNGRQFTPIEKEEWVRETTRLFLHGVLPDEGARGGAGHIDPAREEQPR